MSIPPPDLRRLLGVAERAARAGGTVIRTKHAAAGAGPATQKGTGDYVTEIDLASEKTIAMRLRGETPDIPILAEEEGGETGQRYWVVDPLDGTTNFLHGLPIVGVSVALILEGRPVAGCVHAPFSDETYTAVVGGGAHLAKGREPAIKLNVSDRPVQEAVVATGFPFRHKEMIPRHLAVLRKSLERFEDLRRPGAASLDLAWVAAGVFEGFFELGLSSWDVAAGALLIEEAGGVVSDWEGGDTFLGGDIIAGSPEVHEALLELTRSEAAAPAPPSIDAPSSPVQSAHPSPPAEAVTPRPAPSSAPSPSLEQSEELPAVPSYDLDEDWEAIRDREVLADLSSLESDDEIGSSQEDGAGDGEDDPIDEADLLDEDDPDGPTGHVGMRGVPRPAEPVTPPFGGSAFPTRPS